MDEDLKLYDYSKSELETEISSMKNLIYELYDKIDSLNIELLDLREYKLTQYYNENSSRITDLSEMILDLYYECDFQSHYILHQEDYDVKLKDKYEVSDYLLDKLKIPELQSIFLNKTIPRYESNKNKEEVYFNISIIYNNSDAINIEQSYPEFMKYFVPLRINRNIEYCLNTEPLVHIIKEAVFNRSMTEEKWE